MLHNKIPAGKDRKGRNIYQIVEKFHCGYNNIIHAVNQTNCPSYLGHLTMFEYLTHKQPQVLYDLLKTFNLRVKNSNNKFGFDIVGE